MKTKRCLLLLVGTLGIGLGTVKASVALEHEDKTSSPKPGAIVLAEASNPICYMKTQGGQTLDLTSLCSREIRVHIQVDEVGATDDAIYGTVSNPTKNKLTAVRVKYQLIGEDGNVEWRTVNTEPATLEPGKTAIFNFPRSSDREIGDEFYADGRVTP